MTAYVIPNAILVKTSNSEYMFRSFLDRNMTYDVMQDMWHRFQPAIDKSEADDEDPDEHPDVREPNHSEDHDEAQPEHGVTECACGRDGQHYSTVLADYVLQGTPEAIYKLLFKSPFMNDFLVNDQGVQGPSRFY
jgi:hypothetical protein